MADGLSMYENDIVEEASEFPEEPRPVIKSGFTVRECLEPNCNWGIAGVTGKAAACWDCFHVEPCCGEPCNLYSCLYCCCCFYCCCLCTHAKMLAYSNDQEFYCVNHCGPFIIVMAASIIIAGISAALGYIVYPAMSVLGVLGSCGFLALSVLLRRNIRMKYNIGTSYNCIGDCFMVCCPCTSVCSFCQELRAIPVSGWDWFSDIRERGINCISGNELGKIMRL